MADLGKQDFRSDAPSLKTVEPTQQEMQTALVRLDELARPAVFGEIGGAKPTTNDRATSWWGGNFLGAEGEDAPVCTVSGRSMHPVLQIRVDELPDVPSVFEGLALVNIWMDLHASTFWGAENGNGFVVRSYDDLRHLVPVGYGYRESAELPTFPVFWREVALEQPSWEDMAGEVPWNVATSMKSDWFFGSKYAAEVEQLRQTYPIKLGGWPAWIQGSQWPKDAEYFFQVDATEKGRLFLGDAGSFYIFRTAGGWEVRGDCY